MHHKPKLIIVLCNINCFFIMCALLCWSVIWCSSGILTWFVGDFIVGPQNGKRNSLLALFEGPRWSPTPHHFIFLMHLCIIPLNYLLSSYFLYIFSRGVHHHFLVVHHHNELLIGVCIIILFYICMSASYHKITYWAVHDIFLYI
jgi:hypothetical protein